MARNENHTLQILKHIHIYTSTVAVTTGEQVCTLSRPPHYEENVSYRNSLLAIERKKKALERCYPEHLINPENISYIKLNLF